MYISVIVFHRDMEIYIITWNLNRCYKGKPSRDVPRTTRTTNSGPGGRYHTYGRSLRSIKDLASSWKRTVESFLILAKV